MTYSQLFLVSLSKAQIPPTQYDAFPATELKKDVPIFQYLDEKNLAPPSNFQNGLFSTLKISES